jgi:hypothetical protein
LGYTIKNSEYPVSPTEVEIQCLPKNLSKEQILSDQSVFSTSACLLTNSNNRNDWKPFKALLLSDLLRFGIERFTFEWDSSTGEESEWNQLMILFVVKHWNFAKKSLAFFSYDLDIKWNLEIHYIGLMTRWLCGRIEEVKQNFHHPDKVQQRQRNFKRREVNGLNLPLEFTSLKLTHFFCIAV